MAGQRLDRRHQGLTAAVVLGALAACGPPPPPTPGTVPLDVVMAGRRLAGTWEWVYSHGEGGALVRERERWRFAETPDSRRLVGYLQRDVLVRALDGVPFDCNQRPLYHQRATIAVTAEVARDGIAIVERSYDAAPSPCDPGLRQLGAYTATLRGDRLTMTWDGGSAVLQRIAEPPAAATPPQAPPPAGRWRWSVRSWTKAGLVRDEDEDWELAITDGGELAGTYVRTVTVRSPDNQPLPCAGAPAYAFVDRYLLRGKREPEADGGWRLEETAVLPTAHPCTADTPDRTLDAATVASDGDYLVLTWRGKRRQILGRPGAD